MNPCVIPVVPNDDLKEGMWMSQHNCQMAETKGKEPDVVFIGDYIIQELQQRPIWKEWFVPLHSLNLGIGHTGTQHILWRIANGILDHIDPQVIVFHGGGCNVNDTDEQVAEGIFKIVDEISEKLPNTRIILLEIVPRGQYSNPIREKNDKINARLREKYHCSKFVGVVPTSSVLLDADGTIDHHDFFDYLRPTDAGCRKIFEPVYEFISQMLMEDSGDNNWDDNIPGTSYKD